MSVTGFDDLIPDQTTDPTKKPPAKTATGFEDLIPRKREASAPKGFEDLVPDKGAVTVSQPKGVVGPHGESLITSGSMAEIAAGEHGLAPMIGAAQRMGRGRPGYENIGNIPAGEKTDLPVVTADRLEAPNARAALSRDVAKRTAPGAASTATNIALSNLMAPISERMAEGGTEHALAAYAAGGGDPSQHADLFGAAAAVGAVAGNVSVGKALSPALSTGVSATRALPLALTRGGRLGQAMISGAVSQGALGAAGEAITGDANGQRDIGSIVEAGAKQAVAGAAFGAILGGAGEVASSIAEKLAARKLAAPTTTPEVPSLRRRIATAVDPSLELERRAATRAAETDELTGAANRRAYSKALRSAEADPNSSIVRFDLNGFKAVNDVHGHAAGDAVLRAVPKVLAGAAEEAGIPPRVFRVGGDEFAAIVPRSAADDFRELAESRYGIQQHGQGIWTSISGGVGPTDVMADEAAIARKVFQKRAQGFGPRVPAAGTLGTQPDQASGVEYRHSGVGLVPRAVDRIRTTYRKALVTPYAAIERNHPELTNALLESGAAPANASHVAHRAVDWVLKGLTSEQEKAFGRQLVVDNLRAAADARTAGVDASLREVPDADFADAQAAAQRLRDRAAQIVNEMGGEVSGEPWYQAAVARHHQYVEQPLSDAAIAAGVNPQSLRRPTSGYIKLISEDRLTNRELRRAMDANAVEDPSGLRPRGPLSRFLLGEKPGLTRLFPAGASSLREGPINPAAPSTGTDIPGFRRGATRTGSAQSAQGTAREYVTDYRRIIEQDAADKLPRAADNAVYTAVAKSGRELADGEEPAIGKKAVQRTVLDENSHPTVQRFEVEPKVAKALTHYEQQKAMTDNSGWRQITSMATRVQIAGMPVEATAHMNSIASLVGSVPGEKDVVGKVLAGVPMIGGKAAAIREMVTMNMDAPASRALESRLARIGALRVQQEHGGIVNKASNALFGPQGVDVRARIVLARKYLSRKPDGSDAELREFITSKLGNYIRPNSGAAVNAAQSSGASAFARFQAARIPTSVRLTAGQSDLPTSGFVEKVADIANTLYRGPVGYAIGAELLNRASAGHSMTDNERGRQDDVQLPITVGPHDRPLYLPVATLNPVVATGIRATGLRDFLPRPGAPNASGRFADATRDVINTGLGVLSPLARAASVAATGRTPYMTSDGSMLRVVNQGFDQGSNVVNRGKAAMMAANPAVSAFAGQGGDVAGSSLAQALSEDGRFLGGPKAIGARLAAFTLPRLASVGVGGRDNASSVDARDQREYLAAMSEYKAQLRRAAGPKDQDAVISAAVADAIRDGRFDPEIVARELEKYLRTPDDKRDFKREKAAESFVRKHER